MLSCVLGTQDTCPRLQPQGTWRQVTRCVSVLSAPHQQKRRDHAGRVCVLGGLC